MRVFTRWAVAIGLAVAGLGGPALAQEAPAAPQSPDQALAQDAAAYAGRYGVAPEEAVRRLRAQQETVAVTDRLQEKYRKRLAGISIEHRPEYRIVVLLTGSKGVGDQVVQVGGLTVPVVFRTGAEATRRQVVEAIRERAGDIRSAVGDTRGMGLDPRTGELVVMMNEGEAARLDLPFAKALIEDIAGVPARIRILERPETNFAVEGGARVEGTDTVSGKHAYCTTGFTVTDGTRAGIITAAHCPDILTYFDPDGRQLELPFLGQWGWSFQDVQLNAVEEARGPVFYADAAKKTVRTLAGARSRAATRAGDFLCHRGERTGYSCAEVELTDYAPPGALCGGPCAPTWVTVAGPSCGGGDSGGPVFSGAIAYGIVKGGTYTATGRCAFYYYMSLDYMPDGWSLLTAPTAGEPDAPPSQAARRPGSRSPGS
ncbi:MAG TPA: hypothetical protein VF727_13245 [Allosphingosinicella sp.]